MTVVQTRCQQQFEGHRAHLRGDFRDREFRVPVRQVASQRRRARRGPPRGVRPGSPARVSGPGLRPGSPVQAPGPGPRSRPPVRLRAASARLSMASGSPGGTGCPAASTGPSRVIMSCALSRAWSRWGAAAAYRSILRAIRRRAGETAMESRAAAMVSVRACSDGSAARSRRSADPAASTSPVRKRGTFMITTVSLRRAPRNGRDHEKGRDVAAAPDASRGHGRTIRCGRFGTM
jgi:hypothetical protein